MKRKEKTELLRNLLKAKLNSKRGVHSAAEVSLDYGTKNVKRVDFVSFEPRDQISIAGLESGVFTFYEVKSCREDFKSGFGLNFEGDRNYVVTDMPTYKDLLSHGDLDDVNRSAINRQASCFNDHNITKSFSFTRSPQALLRAVPALVYKGFRLIV